MDKVVKDSKYYLLLKRTKKIKRYLDPRYPRGMVKDNVFNHTIRCVSLVDQFDLDKILKLKVKNLLIIHDIPEIFIGDHPVAAVKDGLIKKPDDLIYAKTVFLPDDYNDYKQFVLASKFFSSNSMTTPDLYALIAKIIDMQEGNYYFHVNLSSWLKSKHIGLPPKSALTYTFLCYTKIKNNINRINNSKDRIILHKINDYFINVVENIWKNNTATPDLIIKFMNKVKNI